MKARLPKGMGGGPQDMGAMLRQAQKMQEDMQNLRPTLKQENMRSPQAAVLSP